MLACLGALSQVGGVAFNRALKATKAKALGPRVVERAQKGWWCARRLQHVWDLRLTVYVSLLACLLHADATCTDVLVDILVRYV